MRKFGWGMRGRNEICHKLDAKWSAGDPVHYPKSPSTRIMGQSYGGVGKEMSGKMGTMRVGKKPPHAPL